jgi:hypothetical protein
VEKRYAENGKLIYEITFLNGKGIDGFIYDDYGNKTPMTNAHIHNLTKLKIVTVSNFDDIY